VPPTNLFDFEFKLKETLTYRKNERDSVKSGIVWAEIGQTLRYRNDLKYEVGGEITIGSKCLGINVEVWELRKR